ncbi:MULTISPECIES: hypothetical protein [unclassified Brachybacterium]|uniref:hypothetical protein n=1 Tax=unclassified Brachybacterium TaxID=2623841 RepID=UPI002615448D|nr:hypothetical protein [uncultured Brachybacterium sp.]
MVALTDAMTKAIDIAREAPNGRHAELLIHDGPLRQTVIALKAGAQLPEHNSPPAASIQVMHGSLRVTAQEPVVLQTGQIEALTHFRHSVEALEDTVFLLTTVTSQHDTDSHATRTGEMPVLSKEAQAAEYAEMDHESGGGRTDR